MKVSSGEATLNYVDAQAIIGRLPNVMIPPINDAHFSSELPLPSNLTCLLQIHPAMDLGFRHAVYPSVFVPSLGVSYSF